MASRDYNATETMDNVSPLPIAGFPFIQAYSYGLITATLFFFIGIARNLTRLLALVQRQFRIPSGPWGFPLFGSFPMLTAYPERTLDRWALKYGDLFSVKLGNQLFVVVSSPKVAKDLMVTNGSVFSDRKEMFVKSQTVFVGRGITATPYNDRWYVSQKFAWYRRLSR
jgi:hypothetical protein